MISFVKRAVNNCLPIFWLEKNYKEGHFGILSLLRYRNDCKWLPINNKYELIFKDENFALIDDDFGDVFCVHTEDITEKEIQIKIGDTVKVINGDFVYDSYKQFFLNNKDEIGDDLLAKWQYKREPNLAYKYVVKFIGRHSNGNLLLVIEEEFTEKVYLIGREGVEKIES